MGMGIAYYGDLTTNYENGCPLAIGTGVPIGWMGTPKLRVLGVPTMEMGTAIRTWTANFGYVHY